METTNRSNTSPNPGKSNLGLAVGVVVVILLFVVGLIPKLRAADKLQKQAADVSSELPEVDVTSPRLAVAENLELPGSVEAISDTAIQARTSGYISKIYVDIGAHVKAGQVLADIESPDVDQQLAQANADTAKSRATVGQSQADVARLQAGVSQSQSDLVRQNANVKQAKASLAGSRAKYLAAVSGESASEAALAQAQQGVAVQRANLAQSQAQYDLAKTTEKRYRDLLEKGFVAQQDYDQSASGLKTAAATVQASRATLLAAQSNVRASQQAVQSAKALVESAQADKEAAEANVSATEATYQSQKETILAAKASVQAGFSTVDANRAAVISSQANARRYSVLSGFQHVVAPFDGVITARNVDIGSLVNPGTAITSSSSATQISGLFGIARGDVLRIFVNIPQSAFQWARPGTKATVLIREIPNQKFVGTVFQASGALNENSRTLLTEIRLPNPKGVLLPGMYAQVLISSPTDKKSIRVPSSVLLVDAQGTRIGVVDDQNHAHLNKVVLGKDYGTEIEVVSGIGPKDRLISNPSDDVKDGGEVKVNAGAKG